MHKVVQVIPKHDYKVYVYFADGKIKLYDAKDIVQKGLFKKLTKNDLFINSCTVLNDTLAWDIAGDFDITKCLDIDPETIYQTCPDVEENKIILSA